MPQLEQKENNEGGDLLEMGLLSSRRATRVWLLVVLFLGGWGAFWFSPQLIGLVRNWLEL